MLTCCNFLVDPCDAHLLRASVPFTAPQGRSSGCAAIGAGIIKVVFATATLAAGINMPARSTIISSTSVRHAPSIFVVRHALMAVDN